MGYTITIEDLSYKQLHELNNKLEPFFQWCKRNQR